MEYISLADHLKKKYGGKLRKICIDAGFTCPNRDGRCGVGGCIFCGARGAGEHIEGGIGISEQVMKYFEAPKAAAGCSAATEGNSVMVRITKNPAPALMPSTLGAARGLSVTFCKSDPESASPAPANRPASIRGRRMARRMTAALLCSERPSKPPKNSAFVR